MQKNESNYLGSRCIDCLACTGKRPIMRRVVVISVFQKLSKYRKKAVVAISCKILVIIFNVLSTKKPFDHKKNMQAEKA